MSIKMQKKNSRVTIDIYLIFNKYFAISLLSLKKKSYTNSYSVIIEVFKRLAGNF